MQDAITTCKNINKIKKLETPKIFNFILLNFIRKTKTLRQCCRTVWKFDLEKELCNNSLYLKQQRKRHKNDRIFLLNRSSL